MQEITKSKKELIIIIESKLIRFSLDILILRAAYRSYTTKKYERIINTFSNEFLSNDIFVLVLNWEILKKMSSKRLVLDFKERFGF
jgi:hypothetical protein